MKLITFDFEGTLVDNQWNQRDAEKDALREMQEKGVPTHLFDGLNYTTIYNLVSAKQKEWGFEDGQLTSILDSVYDFYDNDASIRWEYVFDLHKMLNNIKGSYKIALVTNGGRKGMEQTLKKFDLDNTFGKVITRNDVQMLKPSSEGIKKALEWAGAEKSNALHVGDTMADILAAREAGVKVAIVIASNNNPEKLLQAKPHLILKKLTDLPWHLKNINFL